MTQAELRYKLDRITGPHDGTGTVHGILKPTQRGTVLETQAPVPICKRCPRNQRSTCAGLRTIGSPRGNLFTVPKNGVFVQATYTGEQPQDTPCLEEQTVLMQKGELSYL